MNTHLVVGAVLAVIYVAVSVGVLTIARKSRNGTLPRNPLVGVRTRETLGDDSSWRAGQREARRRYVRLVPVLAGAAIASLVNALVEGPFWGFAVIVAVSGALDLAIATSSAAAANSAARRERHRPV
ncbi:SdpI family protein [Streptomyces violascens]|uniref:SdpI family protein n=1 Tax=Streptomyces violascens TaxID=67381 RepID=UPI0036B699CC